VSVACVIRGRRAGGLDGGNGGVSVFATSVAALWMRLRSNIVVGKTGSNSNTEVWRIDQQHCCVVDGGDEWDGGRDNDFRSVEGNSKF
jgi:hypothetical protein